MSQEFLENVKKIVSQKISPAVADSVIRVSCGRIGVKPEELNKDRLDVFIDNLKITLMLFLEDDEVVQIIKEIKEIDTK